MSEYSILGFAFLVLSPISIYQIHHTQVVLHYGRKLASQDFLASNPRGFQDALTDPSGNKWFFIVQGSLLAIMIGYFYFGNWKVGLAAIGIWFLLALILRRILPPEHSPKWATKIFASLCRREADYKRDGDELRYEAMKSLREDFQERFVDNILQNNEDIR
jgi:hypothetical protein